MPKSQEQVRDLFNHADISVGSEVRCRGGHLDGKGVEGCDGSCGSRRRRRGGSGGSRHRIKMLKEQGKLNGGSLVESLNKGMMVKIRRGALIGARNPAELLNDPATLTRKLIAQDRRAA